MRVEETKKDLEGSIASLKKERRKIELLVEKAERLNASDSINILRSDLDRLEKRQKSFEKDSLFLKNGSIKSDKSRDSLVNILTNRIEEKKRDNILIDQQLNTRAQNIKTLSKKNLENKAKIQSIRDEIERQLIADTSYIRTYQATLFRALEQEDYSSAKHAIKEIKAILSKQFYTSTSCQEIRNSFSKQFYTNERKHQKTKKDIEVNEQVIDTILKAENILNQKYSQEDINQSITALSSILNIKVVKQRKNILEKIEMLSNLLEKYCKENNNAYDLAEYIINGIPLNEKDKRDIINLKLTYPHLYSIFRTRNDKELLVKGSNHYLTRQNSCK